MPSWVIVLCKNVDEKWQFLWCMVSKSSNFEQNFIKLIHNVKYQNVFPTFYHTVIYNVYCNIPSGIIALSSWNFAIICNIESLTQVISNGTLQNFDTMLNTKMSCSCSKMIHIILWLQQLLPFVHQNMSCLTFLVRICKFCHSRASVSLTFLVSFKRGPLWYGFFSLCITFAYMRLPPETIHVDMI